MSLHLNLKRHRRHKDELLTSRDIARALMSCNDLPVIYLGSRPNCRDPNGFRRVARKVGIGDSRSGRFMTVLRWPLASFDQFVGKDLRHWN